MIAGVNGADRHVVVVGGGISGLAAAHALRQALPAVRITLVEESARLGGKLCTGELGGAVVETGADNWLARVPEATALANAVGADLVTPATGDAWLWLGDRLRRLPPGTVRGVPSRIRPSGTSSESTRTSSAPPPAWTTGPTAVSKCSSPSWAPTRPIADPTLP